MPAPSTKQIVAMWEAKLRQRMGEDGATVPTAEHIAWLMDSCAGDYTHAAQAVQVVQSDPPVEEVI